MTPRTDPTHRVDETITRSPHAPHDPSITAGHDPTPHPTHPTHPDPTFPSPSIQGRERGQAGRRARSSAARATFTAARQRGLVARHRAKLARLAQANPDAKHHCGYCTRDVPLVTAYDHTTACRRAHQEGQGS